MTFDAFTTLASVRAFLADQILDSVPQALRSELRAAIKLLSEVEQELNASPSVLIPEAQQLLDSCDRGAALLSGADQEFIARGETIRKRLHAKQSLRDIIAAHQDARRLTSSVLCGLLRVQTSDTDEAKSKEINGTVDILMTELAKQAAARHSWQSVFRTQEDTQRDTEMHR